MENQEKASAEMSLAYESAPIFKKTESDKWDRCFAVLYLLLGYGLWKIFEFDEVPFLGQTENGFQLKVAGFTLFYLAVLWSYSRLKGLKVTKEKIFWTVILLCVGVSYGFYSIIPVAQFLLWFVAAAYGTLAVMDGLLVGKRTSSWVLLDLWHGLFSLPVLNFFCQIRVAFQIYKGKKEKKEGQKIFLGIVCAIPVLAIILPALSSADKKFASLIDLAFSRITIGGGLMSNLLCLIMSLIFGGLMFGVSYGSVYRRHIDASVCEEWEEESGEGFHMIPDTSIYTFAMIISLVYVLFMIIQGQYLFSACLGILPENLTYAQYARQGFFELCGVAALNVCLLLFMNVCSRTIRRENHRLRILNIVFSLLTLLLLVTAMSRMGMYIYVYGFTVKRILTSIFMIWLFLVFSMVIVLQKKDIPVVRWAVFSGAVLFAALCVLPLNLLL